MSRVPPDVGTKTAAYKSLGGMICGLGLLLLLTGLGCGIAMSSAYQEYVLMMFNDTLLEAKRQKPFPKWPNEPTCKLASGFGTSFISQHPNISPEKRRAEMMGCLSYAEGNWIGLWERLDTFRFDESQVQRFIDQSGYDWRTQERMASLLFLQLKFRAWASTSQPLIITGPILILVGLVLLFLPCLLGEPEAFANYHKLSHADETADGDERCCPLHPIELSFIEPPRNYPAAVYPVSCVITVFLTILLCWAATPQKGPNTSKKPPISFYLSQSYWIAIHGFFITAGFILKIVWDRHSEAFTSGSSGATVPHSIAFITGIFSSVSLFSLALCDGGHSRRSGLPGNVDGRIYHMLFVKMFFISTSVYETIHTALYCTYMIRNRKYNTITITMLTVFIVSGCLTVTFFSIWINQSLSDLAVRGHIFQWLTVFNVMLYFFPISFLYLFGRVEDEHTSSASDKLLPGQEL